MPPLRPLQEAGRGFHEEFGVVVFVGEECIEGESDIRAFLCNLFGAYVDDSLSECFSHGVFLSYTTIAIIERSCPYFSGSLRFMFSENVLLRSARSSDQFLNNSVNSGFLM